MLTLTVLLNTSFSFSDENWKLASDKDGIKCYSLDIEGSQHKHFKGTTTVKADLDVLLEIITDVSAYPEWFFMSKEVKVLKKEKNLTIAHSINKSIWPAKERDAVTEGTVIVDKENKTVTAQVVSSKSDIVPPSKKYVRLKNFEMKFVLKRIDKKHIHVTCILKANPGGLVPAMLSNIINQQNPYYSLKGLKKMITKDKYLKNKGNFTYTELVKDI